MKKIVIALAKKYIISALNDLMTQNKDNVSQICYTIKKWTGKLNIITTQLSKIAERCEDGKLEDEEINSSVNEITEIVKGW